jgi:hypothetical protein
MAEAPEPKPDEAIAALEEQVAALKSRIEELIVERDVSRTKYYAAEKSEEETRAQFADLKERLETAEQLNSEMRGYLKRVQEDDAVREELVAVGDPNGEQQLVPKRKSTPFMAPTPYSQFGGEDTAMAYTRFRGEKPRPRHWVTY